MCHNRNMIYNSISFIESRLSDELNINELAKQAFFSKTQYKRLFQAVVGEPVMEYIKKRRMQRAVMTLCETDASVLEIALQFGYTSHEGFSRAFKVHFGIAPLQYRKRYAAAKINQYHEEVRNMITNEARKSITQSINDITKELEVLVANLDNWKVPAQQEIEKAGRNACGMRIAFREWASLSARISAAKYEIQKIPAEMETGYDLYDKADQMMKMLDDIIFQMNLLRFLTGVEQSRMGEHGIPFEPILEGLTALCETENTRKEAVLKLIVEINKQVQAEIKREAIHRIQQSTEVLREAVGEGVSLTEKLNALVIKLGAQGRGFALIAKETEKGVSCVRDTEACLAHLVDEMGKTHNTAVNVIIHNTITMAMVRLADSAFKMNLNAFNATVESARAGDTEECVECAQGIRDYAGRMQILYKKSDELNKDFMKLMDLLRTKDEDAEKRQFWKALDDIIFQAGFLNTQLNLESERTGRNNFLTLSRDFEKALETLIQERQGEEQMNKTDMLKAFTKNILSLIERGKTEAKAAGDHGVGISYILKEYSQFASRLS